MAINSTFSVWAIRAKENTWDTWLGHAPNHTPPIRSPSADHTMLWQLIAELFRFHSSIFTQRKRKFITNYWGLCLYLYTSFIVFNTGSYQLGGQTNCSQDAYGTQTDDHDSDLPGSLLSFSRTAPDLFSPHARWPCEPLDVKIILFFPTAVC